jgi:uncharacterized GH25 family protein
MTFRWLRTLVDGGAGRVASSCALVASLAWSAAAHGHQVWLEGDAAGASLYFGEFGDNLHEVSPGYLDKLKRPAATVVSVRGEKSLEPKKGRDAYVFAGKLAKDESVVAVDAFYPILESKDGNETVRTAWTPAARYLPELRAQPAKLVLDVVPTNGEGEFQVSYRGVPLAKAEVSLVAVSGWSLKGVSDEQGKISFRLPWKGTYALLVRHKDPTPGTRKTEQGTDEPFDAASFATTLTFVTSAGLPSPPPPPAAPPNELEKKK